MHKGGHTLKVQFTGNRVVIGDREIDVRETRPIDLMLAALAYGIGARYIDATGEPFEMECYIDGYQITCMAKCTGQEEKCLIYQTLTKGLLKFQCVKKLASSPQ